MDEQAQYVKAMQLIRSLDGPVQGRLLASLLTEQGTQLGEWHIQIKHSNLAPLVVDCKVDDVSRIVLLCDGKAILNRPVSDPDLEAALRELYCIPSEAYASDSDPWQHIRDIKDRLIGIRDHLLRYKWAKEEMLDQEEEPDDPGA